MPDRSVGYKINRDTSAGVKNGHYMAGGMPANRNVGY
jgi:hypothetical protein